MRTRYGIISGLIILALISMAGVCAAEETTPGTASLTGGQPFYPPGPGYNMTGSNWTGMMNGIRPYNGTIGADNALYGLRIAFENLDETFTFNETELVEKQVTHMENRLSEYMLELQLNRSESANHVLGLYWEKMNQTEQTLAPLQPDDTGLLRAQERITKHQAVLGTLLSANPDNKGLARAYNNSIALENKFEQKTQTRLERVVENDKVTVKAVRLEINEQERVKNTGMNQTVRVQQDQQVQQGKADQTGRQDANGQAQNTGNTQDAKKTQDNNQVQQGQNGGQKK